MNHYLVDKLSVDLNNIIDLEIDPLIIELKKNYKNEQNKEKLRNIFMLLNIFLTKITQCISSKFSKYLIHFNDKLYLPAEESILENYSKLKDTNSISSEFINLFESFDKFIVNVDKLIEQDNKKLDDIYIGLETISNKIITLLHIKISKTLLESFSVPSDKN